MFFYIIVAVASCLLAYPVMTTKSGIIQYGSRQQMVNHVCMGFLFLLLFVVSAFRDHVGADYNKYIINFNEVYYDAYVATEVGYNFIVKAIYKMAGSMNYYLIFAFFSFITIIVFLRAMYQQSEWFFLTFFMYMMLGMYYISFTTMRYYFVLGCALLLMQQVIKRKFIGFIVFTLILSLFHKSILVIIPVYLLAMIPWKKWHLIIIALFASTGLFLRDFYYNIILRLYPSYEDTPFLEAGTSYVCILRCMAVLMLGLLYYKTAIKDNKTNRFYMTLNYFALLLYLFGSFIPVISRIGYYMMISQILLVPSIIMKIQDQRQKKMITALVFIAGVIYFGLFLRNAYDAGLGLLPYRSIFI